MMWKILTAQIREETYYLVVSRGLFPQEQKGCHKRTRDTSDCLYIDEHILKESKNETEKSSYGVDWLQKGLRYGPPKLNSILYSNVQNIRQSHKSHKTAKRAGG